MLIPIIQILWVSFFLAATDHPIAPQPLSPKEWAEECGTIISLKPIKRLDTKHVEGIFSVDERTHVGRVRLQGTTHELALTQKAEKVKKKGDWAFGDSHDETWSNGEVSLSLKYVVTRPDMNGYYLEGNIQIQYRASSKTFRIYGWCGC